MDLPDIRDVRSLRGKRVLVRASLNVPVQGATVVNDYRLRRACATLTFLKDAGARVIAIGHQGRKPTDSLDMVAVALAEHVPVRFVRDTIGPAAEDAAAGVAEGEIILLENLRQKDGEYQNDESFARRLVSFADLYVNDAFAVSHREHASIVGIPKYLPSYAGILMRDEVTRLSEALDPPSPSLCVIGGAKFPTKAPLIQKFLDLYDHTFVGGVHANNIFKEKGLSVGLSQVDETHFDLGPILSHKKLLLPVDVRGKNAEGVFTKKVEEIEQQDAILDAGPETLSVLQKRVAEAKFVLWNGPLGDYEKGFVDQTERLAEEIATSGVRSVVGGGDTVAVISKMGLEHRFSFISTGGGAMLRFLLDGTLPGIEALVKK